MTQNNRGKQYERKNFPFWWHLIFIVKGNIAHDIYTHYISIQIIQIEDLTFSNSLHVDIYKCHPTNKSNKEDNKYEYCLENIKCSYYPIIFPII